MAFEGKELNVKKWKASLLSNLWACTRAIDMECPSSTVNFIDWVDGGLGVKYDYSLYYHVL